ncbi:hypothetical protein D3C81_2210140 [compost metagenome]
MYWMNPTMESGSSCMDLANQNKGIAVATPDSRRSTMNNGDKEVKVPVPCAPV